jgi:hypothetical protein
MGKVGSCSLTTVPAKRAVAVVVGLPMGTLRPDNPLQPTKMAANPPSVSQRQNPTTRHLREFGSAMLRP